MKTYWAAFLMRAKMEAQYRAAALSGLATQLFFGLILVYLYRALYGAGADLAALASTATYVWIQQAFFRMVCADDNTLTAAIIKGDMAYQLVRPVDQYNFWFARNLAMKLVGALMRALPLLLPVRACQPWRADALAPVAPAGACRRDRAVQHQRRAGAGHAGQPRSKRGHHLFDPVSVRQYPPADALSRPLAALHSMAALRADFGRAHSPVHR